VNLHFQDLGQVTALINDPQLALGLGTIHKPAS